MDWPWLCFEEGQRSTPTSGAALAGAARAESEVAGKPLVVAHGDPVTWFSGPPAARGFSFGN